MMFNTRAAITAFVLAAAPVAAFSEAFTATTQLPESHYMTENLATFGGLISERSGGAMSLQIFASAALFKDNQVPEAVGSGAVDIGAVSMARYAGAVPAINATALPFLLDDEEQLRAAIAPGSAFREILDPAILKETNNKVLWWQMGGRNVYLSDGAPMTSPAAFVGKKVRTYGKVQSWTVEAMGGAPTLISGSEQFLAYQQGTVDVGMTGSASVESRAIYEVMDTLTRTYDSAILWAVVMNNDKWEALSDEHKAIVHEAALEVEQQITDAAIQEEEEVIASLRNKMNVVDLTEAERNTLRDATLQVRDLFVADAGETGQKALDALSQE